MDSLKALFDEKIGCFGWAIRDNGAVKISSEFFSQSDDGAQKKLINQQNRLISQQKWLICQRKRVFCKVRTEFVGDFF